MTESAGMDYRPCVFLCEDIITILKSSAVYQNVPCRRLQVHCVYHKTRL